MFGEMLKILHLQDILLHISGGIWLHEERL
jgi:hypothetical protein